MQKRTIFFSIIVLLLTTTEHLQAETITWYQPDFPPYVILEGPNKIHGIDNKIVQSMIDYLPEYEHVFKVANYKRILSDLESGNNGVITPLFRTPKREKFIQYTKQPSYLVFSNGFIYRKTDKDKFTPFITQDGTLDLQALCRSGKFTIGINSGRSYYGIIDKLIKKHRQDKVFLTRAAIDQLGLLSMLVSKRIDAAFGFPVEIKYAGLEQKLNYLIVSQMDALTPVYFGAPKNRFGMQLIENLNNILMEKKLSGQFTDNYMYWLDDQTLDTYLKLIKKHNYN